MSKKEIKISFMEKNGKWKSKSWKDKTKKKKQFEEPKVASSIKLLTAKLLNK